MNMLDNVLFEVRHNLRWVVMLVSVLVIGAVIIGAAVIGGFAFAQTRLGPPENAADTRIPLEAYGHGAVLVFDCIQRGEDQCPEYDQAVGYLQLSTMAGGITYQPLSDDAPGTENEDGTKTVSFDEESPAEDYQAFANSVTLDGAVTPSTAPEIAFTESGTTTNSVNFTYQGQEQAPGGSGTITFTLTSQQMVIQSVSYADAPDSTTSTEEATP